jgi:hypothetical protein
MPNWKRTKHRYGTDNTKLIAHVACFVEANNNQNDGALLAGKFAHRFQYLGGLQAWNDVLKFLSSKSVSKKLCLLVESICLVQGDVIRLGLRFFSVDLVCTTYVGQFCVTVRIVSLNFAVV